MVPSGLIARHNDFHPKRARSLFMDQRLQQLNQWLAVQFKEHQFNDESFTVSPVSGDASFRRYFRVEQHSTSSCWIAMDAPPEKEASLPFVAIARHWESKGIKVPHIQAVDLSQGFMLLGDFGDDLMLNSLNPSFNETKASQLYKSALQTLTQIQQCSQPNDYALPPYNAKLLSREMELFRDWLVSKKLEIKLSASENELIDKAFQFLIDEALSQPMVCVHRDYHSRNLMEIDDQASDSPSIGVLDFQDAVMGPITYDPVSLLRDCYIALPPEFVDQRLQEFYQATQSVKLHDATYPQFKQWFDLMGIQRHLKAAGIFARLSLRDGKHSYLNDIPRTVNYIEQISANYVQLQAFNQWLNSKVIPAIQDKLLSDNCEYS